MRHSASDELRELASLLVFLQGAIGLSLAFEAVGGALLLGAGGLGAVLSLAGAVFTFRLARGVGRGSDRALRWTRRLQYGWLATAALDLGLSVLVAGIGPAPTPLLTRVALPGAILVLVRRIRWAEAATVPEAVEVVA